MRAILRAFGAFLASLIPLVGSLILFGMFFGAQIWMDYHNYGEVTILGRAVKLDWVAQIHLYLDLMARFAMAGVALSIFDRVAAHRLSLKWALSRKHDASPIERAAVIVGWCMLAAAFVTAFSP